MSLRFFSPLSIYYHHKFRILSLDESNALFQPDNPKIPCRLCKTVGMTTLLILSLLSDWSTRVKQIAKLWRKASSQDRAPYVVRSSIISFFYYLKA